MPSRRDQIKMSDEEVQEFLAGRRTTNIATATPTASGATSSASSPGTGVY
jgi:hypothetical protein